MDRYLILAPLQGFTDVVYRSAWARHFKGLDEALAPFIPTMGNNRIKPARLRDVRPDLNTALPVVPQILGNSARDFLNLARHLEAMGHQTVNWNLGCPHAKVAKKRRGSGLLPFPETIDAFLDEVLSGMACRLSVKVRLGRSDPREILDLMPVFNRYPLAEIIIHPRTGEQMYDGAADVDAFEDLAGKTRHTLVYNGDITSTAVFERLAHRFPGVGRFMIGRGVLNNPFLPEMICGIDTPPDRRVERLKPFHDDLFQGYEAVLKGPGHLTGRMKGFWSYLSPGFRDAKKAIKAIVKSRTRDGYLECVNQFFDSRPRFEPPA